MVSSPVITASPTVIKTIAASSSATIHSAISTESTSSSSAVTAEPASSSTVSAAASLSGRLHDNGHTEQAVAIELVHGILGIAGALELHETEVDLLPAILEIEIDQISVVSEQVLHVARMRPVGNVAHVQTVFGHRFTTAPSKSTSAHGGGCG